jgi:hypothetical protein
MKSKTLRWTGCIIGILVLGVGATALAQYPPPPEHFGGLINDYTPETGGGPWEMRGTWHLDLKEHSHTADFSAVMNMTHSDYWVVLNPSAVNDNTATGRHPHTHHITMENASVVPLPTGGFEVSGPVSVTADGAAAPFMPSCLPATPCTLTVDITGGSVVEFSNITMKFSGAPTGHFGSQAIHGVVRESRLSEFDDDHDHR